MNKGWIKLWRKIQENPIYRDGVAMRVLVDLLLTANEDGIAITGRFTRAEKLGLKPSAYRRALLRLKSDSIVDIQPSNQFTKVSLCKWKEHQATKAEERTASRTTIGQPSDNHRTHSKNKNKNKNTNTKVLVGEQTPKELSIKFFSDEVYREKLIQEAILSGMPEEGVRSEIKRFVGYWTELNPSGTKQRWQMEKVFEVKRRLSTWFSRAGGGHNKTKGKKGVRIS